MTIESGDRETREERLSAELERLRQWIAELECIDAERTRTEEAYQSQLRETMLLNRIMAVVTSTLDAQHVLETICEELARALHLPRVTFALLDDANKILTVVAEYCAPDTPSALGVVIPAGGNDISQHVLTRHEPLAVDDAQTDSRNANMLADERRLGVVSLLIVPLLVRGRAIGTLGLDSPTRRIYHSEEIALAQNVAAIAGQALEHARLYQAVQQELAERRRAEEYLRGSEARNRALLDAMPDLMFLFDREERYLDFHAGDPKHLFVPPEEFLGKRQRDVISQELYEAWLPCFRRVLETGKTQTLDYTLPIRSETYRFEARLVLCEDDKVMSIVRDITERERMREELQRNRNLESLGVLAGGIAHDFNNLLVAVLGNVSFAKRLILESSDANDQLLIRLLDEAEKGSQRARDLAGQLLTFSRGGTPIKRTGVLSDVLREPTQFVLRGTQVCCEFDIPDDLWFVHMDQGQISQVVQNIVINAEQAMPNGGTIWIAARNVRLAEGEIESLPAGDYVCVAFIDEGIGIPRENLNRVFDPYFTTKDVGNGLGLSISFSIIDRHNGHIEVDSTPGAGTTFTVYLPAVARPLVCADVQIEDLSTERDHGKILVMDDDEAVREFVSNVLGWFGYEVTLAHEGREVVELYRRAIEEGAPYDAVILDLTVQGGMGGHQALSLLQEADAGVRAIVSSGYAHDPVMSDCERYGFKACIAKPYGVSKLRAVLQRVLWGTEDPRPCP